MNATKINVLDPSPGVYYDVSMDDYLSIDAVSSSLLKSLLISPLDCWVKNVDPYRDTERMTTPQMEVGSAYHDALLEPESFFMRNAEKFKLPDDVIDSVEDLKAECRKKGLAVGGNKLTLAERLFSEGGMDRKDLGPLLLEDYKNNLAGRRVLSSDVWADIKLCMQLMKQSGLGDLFGRKNGAPEVTYIWRDPALNNALCKARPDFEMHDTKDIVALKTCNNSMSLNWDENVARRVFTENYHIEAAWYKRASSFVYPDLWGTTKPCPAFFFFFVQQGAVPNLSHTQFGGNPEDNEYEKVAFDDLEYVMDAYNKYMDKFGRDTPWQSEIHVKRFATSDFPFWALRR